MIFRPPFALTLAALAATAAQAENRQLDAHQHGHGALNFAFEGNSVAMELEAPGADIVGFEHPAENAADRALIDAAIAELANPLELFVMPAAAGCSVTAANVELHGDEHHADDHADHDDEAHHDDHDEHHDDEHHDDEEHANGHEDEHDADHDDHHDDEGSEASHTEFHAEYELTCADPSAIDAIEFAYFERFPNAAELDIQLISDKGAKGFEVERDEPRLNLSGAI